MAEITGQPVLTGVKLHDATVMQGFAWDAGSSTWVFSQVQPGGRAHGNLTLTQVDPDGNRLGFMRLTGFGHGVSIATERAGGDLWIWTETKSVLDQKGEGFGCCIARFRWQNGATLDVGDVDVYAPNPGGLGHTPCLDRTKGLVAVRYHSEQPGSDQTGLHTVALYHRAAFLDRDFTAISRTPPHDPPATVQGPATVQRPTVQGWALLADDVTFALLTGKPYGPDNPHGNTTLTLFGLDGHKLSQDAVTAGSELSYREPEGLNVSHSGRLYAGFASGPRHARLANLYELQIGA